MTDEREQEAEETIGNEVETLAEGQEGELDELTALRLELDEVRAREAEYLDGWQRARAELSNARKRFQREQQQSYTNAQADILIRLLPIVDDFERAAETLPEDLTGSTWIEGVMLVQRKLCQLLEQAGVTPIDAVGQEFDPFAHEAATHEPSEVVPEGRVIDEMQGGYRLGDRVLRPSMVRVSSGSPQRVEPGPEPTESDNPGEAPSAS
ncbi:nucleotide exchange factor GrpE [Chloroflexota bacterium]